MHTRIGSVLLTSNFVLQEQLTGVTLEDIIVELAVVISVADDPTEQTNDSVRVVVLVFGNISTSVNTIHSTDINVQVRIIDELEFNRAYC